MNALSVLLIAINEQFATANQVYPPIISYDTASTFCVFVILHMLLRTLICKRFIKVSLLISVDARYRV